MAKITLNGKPQHTSAATLLELKQQFLKPADVVIYNGFQTDQDFPLQDGDVVASTSKEGSRRIKTNWKADVCAPHTGSSSKSQGKQSGHCRAGRAWLQCSGSYWLALEWVIYSCGFRYCGTQQSKSAELLHLSSGHGKNRSHAAANSANQPFFGDHNPNGTGYRKKTPPPCFKAMT